MQNNYEFWAEYLKKIRKEILLLCKNKNDIYIDMHIHSNYSADGKQNIKQILESTKEKGFDVIAITDHDNIDVYDEIYNYVKTGITYPIIVPGIEFTVDNREYGNQCHILQLFVNPKDKEIIKNVKTNYVASFNRSKIQFKRLKENKAIQEILKKANIKISYLDYVEFIQKESLFPEYDTLIKYLMTKFKAKNITTFEILERLEFYNNIDCYEDRKNHKIKKFKKLKEKYAFEEINYYNERFLLSMLAIKEVDDNWWDKPSSGSLSVNSYGQLKVEELNTNFITVFAHPTETKLSIVSKIIDENKNIIGLEKNIRNEYNNINNFMNLLKNKKLYKIIGSDSHDNSMIFYEDMDFYKISAKEFANFEKECNNGKN